MRTKFITARTMHADNERQVVELMLSSSKDAFTTMDNAEVISIVPIDFQTKEGAEALRGLNLLADDPRLPIYTMLEEMLTQAYIQGARDVRDGKQVPI